MPGMSQVNDIRARRTQGEPMRGIASDLGISRDTVKKHIDEEDFSPKPPVREKRPSGQGHHPVLDRGGQVRLAQTASRG